MGDVTAGDVGGATGGDETDGAIVTGVTMVGGVTVAMVVVVVVVGASVVDVWDVEWFVKRNDVGNIEIGSSRFDWLLDRVGNGMGWVDDELHGTSGWLGVPAVVPTNGKARTMVAATDMAMSAKRCFRIGTFLSVEPVFE